MMTQPSLSAAAYRNDGELTGTPLLDRTAPIVRWPPLEGTRTSAFPSSSIFQLPSKSGSWHFVAENVARNRQRKCRNELEPP